MQTPSLSIADQIASALSLFMPKSVDFLSEPGLARQTLVKKLGFP